MNRFISLFNLTIIFVFLAVNAHAQGKSVLVLHSYDPDMTWVRSLQQGIEYVLRKDPLKIDIQTEYMDSKRFNDSVYLSKLFEIYKHKFAKITFDAIICSDNNSLNFLLKYADTLFPDTPIVFCGVNNFQDSMLEGHPLITGVAEAVAFGDTISSVLKMNPDVKRIHIFGAPTPTWESNRELFMRESKPYRDKVDFYMDEGLDIPKAQELISSLGQGDVVLLTSAYRDKNGKMTSFEKSTEEITKFSTVPVFGFWTFQLGHGIVGGKLINGFAQGEEAALIALRILNGESVQSIPPLKESPNKDIFDYNQLQKFSISEKLLPSGSVVTNLPYSFYNEFKLIIWSVVAVFFMLVIIIAFLIINILARKKYANDIAIVNNRLDLAMEGAHFGLWDWDIVSGDVVYNNVWSKILGYSSNEVENSFEFWKSRIHPRDKDATLLEIEKHLSGKADYFYCDHRLLSKSGEWKWVAGRGAVTEWNNQNEPVRMTGVMVDVSKRKLAEDALRKSEEQYRVLVENQTDLVVKVDPKGNFLYVSPSYCNLFGKSEEDLLNQSFMPLVHEDDRESTVKAMKKLYAPPYTAYLEQRAMTKDGWRLLAWADTAVVDEDGNIEAIIGVGRDITDKRMTEDLIVQTEKMISLGEMAAGMAHEINNPLGIILQSVQGAMRRVSLDLAKNVEQAKKSNILLENMNDYLEKRGIFVYLNGIKEAGERASALVSNMLHFCRKSETQFSLCNIVSILESAIDLAHNDFSLKKKFDIKKILFIKEYDSQLPEVSVIPNQMEQVFLNIIKNASQALNEEAMPEGRKPQIVLRVLGKQNAVIIEIEDNGPGIDVATQKRIFDPFFTTKKPGIGTGLGLSVSYYIVTETHGGTIQVMSDPGKWTKFVVTIPCPDSNRNSYMVVQSMC